MKKVAITGSKGIIGNVLMNGLSTKYDLTPIALPEVDVRDENKLLEIFPGHYAVVHLAWDKDSENWENNRFDFDNSLMYSNVYKAALKSKVKRVIMASSVHVEDYLNWEDGSLISVDRKPTPSNVYGLHKIMMENLGRTFSKKGLEVICIRFGGVCPLDIK